MDGFTTLYTVLGGLGLFFYGMKSMSDSLQVLGGSLIKKVIHSMTTNRLLAVGVGTVVTMIVQSSSVTTVMVVGFVNAGLMNLTQAIGVIFGANIGTTVTGWIISIKVSKYGLLLVGLGIFPTLFSKSDKWKYTGRLIFAVGLIFFGLQVMSGAFKPLRSDPTFISYLSLFSDPTYKCYLASVLIGCVLTMVIQSSSAMLGITMAMASSGVIPFHTAAALVLGENIGTTITALLASVGGNIHAKRAARAHAIFNSLGVIVILSIFPYFIEFVESVIPGDSNFINASGDKPNIAFHIASAHTIFNVTSTLIFIPLLSYLARFVIFITPDKTDSQKESKLKFLGDTQGQIADLSLLEANQEILNVKNTLDEMFDLSEKIISNPESDHLTLEAIKDREEITDIAQRDVTVFICKVLEADLTQKQTLQSQSYLRIVDELESIGDYILKMSEACHRLKVDYKFEGKIKEEFLALFNVVRSYYQNVSESFADREKFKAGDFKAKADELWKLSEDLRESQLTGIFEEKPHASTVMTFSDMVVALRKIRSHTLNIFQSMEKLNGNKS